MRRALLIGILVAATGLALPPRLLLAADVAVPVTLENRAVTTDRVIRVEQGDTVRLKWTVDEPLEIHVHGYDILETLEPGAANEVTFEAHATGRFAVTSHGYAADAAKGTKGGHSHGAPHRESALLYIEVHPR